MARKVMVAVHGIGDQFRYETVQSVANQVCRYFGQPAAVPLGQFHSALFVAEPSVTDRVTALADAVNGLKASLEDGSKAEIARSVAAVAAATEAVQAHTPAGAAATPPPPPGAAPAAPAPGGAASLRPPPAALVLKSPPGPDLPVDFGFAEVYWADIPRKPVEDAHTLEEAKKWARTLVERVRLQFLSTQGEVQLVERNYEIAGAVLGEMVETVAVLDRLLFLAAKAGVFRFDLKKVLTDYLGDVQLVTEFEYYRKLILKAFDRVMRDIDATRWETPGGAAEPPAEIYLVAHSEGTVVAFLGLLEGLRKAGADRPPWVDRVKGFMTIGSPINKHLVLWPELWTKLRPPAGGPAGGAAARIEWRNYYDYGDPIGFELETTRGWLKETGWDRYFAFTGADDFGFSRYPFPGKAHNDYWQDDAVFGHFIQTVVKPEKDGRVVAGPTNGVPPANRAGVGVFGRVFPYALAFALCYLGMYLLYKGAYEFLIAGDRGIPTVLRDVLGLTGLVAALIAIARVPRLTVLWRFRLPVWLLLVPAAALYALVTPGTQQLLTVWLPAGCDATGVLLWSTAEMVGLVAVVALGLQVAAVLFPSWGGTRALVIAAGLVCTLFVVRAATDPQWRDGGGSVWPLLLAGAACFYLWWLAALIFDLTFVWHRYIRSSVIENRLRTMYPRGDQYPRVVALLAARLKRPPPHGPRPTAAAHGADADAWDVRAVLAEYPDPAHRRAVLTDAYAEACRQAAAETGKPRKAFPRRYPREIDAALADPPG